MAKSILWILAVFGISVTFVIFMVVPLRLKDSRGMIACGNNNTSNCARTDADQSDKLMDVHAVLLVKAL